MHQPRRYVSHRGFLKKALVEDSSQQTMLPACLDDYIEEANHVRAVDTSIDEFDLRCPVLNGLEMDGFDQFLLTRG